MPSSSVNVIVPPPASLPEIPSSVYVWRVISFVFTNCFETSPFFVATSSSTCQLLGSRHRSTSLYPDAGTEIDPDPSTSLHRFARPVPFTCSYDSCDRMSDVIAAAGPIAANPASRAAAAFAATVFAAAACVAGDTFELVADGFGVDGWNADTPSAKQRMANFIILAEQGRSTTLLCFNSTRSLQTPRT
mmetsp:Transcript_6192/g.18744  ORF Transcript_6192/g.18744 Transcript_6192/m.18744 type:complete len:189 (+) Transcript_6192:711-1277(+)